MDASAFSKLDFELAYLILLTLRGLKPLSRWEGLLSPEQCDIIRAHGLALARVERRARSGRKRTEIVFARNPRRAAFYRRKFDGARLQLTPEVIRTEGRLFGYPACCIETFIRHPYISNGMARADQSILFHWTCRGCRATPALLREYRRVHAECRVLWGGAAPAIARPAPAWPRLAPAWPRLARAAAALMLASGAAGMAAADPAHWLPVSDDADQDYLSVAEEILTGTDWSLADSDGNDVLDGVQLAQRLLALIQSPPAGVVVTEHPMYGLETCAACGADVNMGYIEITHTLRGREVQLPYIALHYLEHGGLSFAGSLHCGRLDVQALKAILAACDEAHLLPLPGPDPDQDGLHSEEEPVLGTDPEEPDSDGDSLIDGPQVAELLLPLVADLPREPREDQPYLREFWTYGYEQCTICGQHVNMGGVEIHNPLEGLSATVPYVALHAAAHGGFVYAGTTNEGHVVPSILQTVVRGDGSAHWIAVPGDGDGDGLTDSEEPFFGLNPEAPDENDNGIPDGRELAIEMAARIGALPEGPLPDRVYVVHHLTFGHYNCVTCGEAINMGFCEIVDPRAGLAAEVPYYNLHFMGRGGFATDREALYPRVDPIAVGRVLGLQASGVPPAGEAQAFVFAARPNPSAAGAATEILLALPGVSGPVGVGVFDSAGRLLKTIYAGAAPAQIARIAWDGRDEAGRALPAGTYLCRVRIGTMSVTRKIVIAQ